MLTAAPQSANPLRSTLPKRFVFSGCSSEVSWQPVPEEVWCHDRSVTSGVFLSACVGAQCLCESPGAEGRLRPVRWTLECSWETAFCDERERVQDFYGYMMKRHSQKRHLFLLQIHFKAVSALCGCLGNTPEQLFATHVHYCWKVWG